MPKATNESILVARKEETTELATTSAEAAQRYEIQAAVIVARGNPRNEDAVFAKLQRICERPSFASDALYSFPRGGQAITGPSVNLAREAARVWGNIRYGLEIIRDDQATNTIQIRGWAWDVETNTKNSADDYFKALVQRKSGKVTSWVVPDERDKRELINRRGAILVRNCLLQILPRDLIEQAQGWCRTTLTRGAKADPADARMRVVEVFATLGVTEDMLVARLKHPLSQCTPDEIAELRTIYRSIADGTARWEDYTQPKQEREAGTLDISDLSAGQEPNRGHGNEGMDYLSGYTESRIR